MTTPTLDICFALQDMTPDEIFADKKFAQELELANVAYFRWNMPSQCTNHSCSTRITEIDSLYKATKEKRLAYYELVKEHYKDKLPLGWDRYLSGWNHFHIFFNTQKEVHSLIEKWAPITPDMYKFIQAVPLYAKFKKFEDGTKKFFSRRCWWHRVNSVIAQSKSYGIAGKTSYSSSDNRSFSYNTTSESWTTVQSLEFRMNGTIDNRIYGLYQAAMLYAVDKTFWEVTPLRSSTSIYDGITAQFSEEDYDSPGCISLDKLHDMWHGFKVSKPDVKKLTANINIMLSLLNKYGLTNSANSLQSYIDEYNILA